MGGSSLELRTQRIAHGFESGLRQAEAPIPVPLSYAVHQERDQLEGPDGPRVTTERNPRAVGDRLEYQAEAGPDRPELSLHIDPGTPRPTPQKSPPASPGS